MTARLIPRLRWSIRSVPYPVLGLLLFSLVLFGVAAAIEVRMLRPLAGKAVRINAEVERLRMAMAVRSQKDVEMDPATQLRRFHESFPNEEDIPAVLQSLHDAAKQTGLTLDQGEYRLLPEVGSGLQRYDIVLPIKGRYGAMRKFIQSILLSNPGVALTGLTFTRQMASEADLTAQIQLGLYFRRVAE